MHIIGARKNIQFYNGFDAVFQHSVFFNALLKNKLKYVYFSIDIIINFHRRVKLNRSPSPKQNMANRNSSRSYSDCDRAFKVIYFGKYFCIKPGIRRIIGMFEANTEHLFGKLSI